MDSNLESKSTPPNTAWCVLKSHRLLAGASPVLVRVRPPGSRQPMWPGDWLCRSVDPLLPQGEQERAEPITHGEGNRSGEEPEKQP